MTDFPRGPGGDGSPQLDLDAIDVFCPNCGVRWLNVGADFLDTPSGCGDCAQAGVRPRERYRFQRLDAWSKSQDLDMGDARNDTEIDALRGRVEELTEALRELLGAVDECVDPLGYAHSIMADDITRARALLARVVPEKETP